MTNLKLIGSGETQADVEPEVITAEEHAQNTNLSAGVYLNYLDYADLVTSQVGQPCIIRLNQPHPLASNLNQRESIRDIRDIAREAGKKLDAAKIREEIAELQLFCELDAPKLNIFRRNAPLPNGGVEIDNVGEHGGRWHVTAEGAKEVKSGGVNVFHRPSTMLPLPLPIPAKDGALSLLDPFFNMLPADKHLLMVVILYVLVHPKVPSTTFPLLFLFGGMGSGKSFLAALVKSLIDPSLQSVQAFPKKLEDLVIIVAGSLMCIFDNIRKITDSQSDHLCLACTHAYDTKRSLYTDDAQFIQLLHGFVCLTGIDSTLVSQPDLIERTVSIELQKISPDNRRSEQEIMAEFDAVKPQIFRGMLDTLSQMLAVLPTVTVKHTARMVDFQRFIAAYEIVTEMPEGELQAHYLDGLNRQMTDGILDDVVSRAVHDFIEFRVDFSGTSTKLLAELVDYADKDLTASKYWPQTPVALGRRLKAVAPKLETAGIAIEFTRGKERLITIRHAD